jgi:hypothetical protein
MSSKRYSITQLLLVLGIAMLAFAAINAKPWATPVSAAVEEAPAAEAALAAPAAVVPGGPGYVMIPAAAFIPSSPDTIYRFSSFDLAVPSGSETGFFFAPVYLPQGARLTGMTMFYIDNANDGNKMIVRMERKTLPSTSSDPSLNPEQVILSVDSVSAGFYRSDTTPDPNRDVVDNSQYKYWLYLTLNAAPSASSHLLFQAVRIDYSFNTVLPLISR